MALVDASPRRMVLDAAGRRVVLAPPEGACLDAEAAQVAPAAAFAVIRGCGGAPDEALRIVSVGSAPLFGPDDSFAGLRALETFLRSPAGRAELGLGGAPEAVRVLDMRRADGALYVLVEDSGEGRLPLASERFWRAFAELNGRVAVVSYAPLTGVEPDPAAMLAGVEEMVFALGEANPEVEPPAPRDAPRPTPPSAR